MATTTQTVADFKAARERADYFRAALFIGTRAKQRDAAEQYEFWSNRCAFLGAMLKAHGS